MEEAEGRDGRKVGVEVVERVKGAAVAADALLALPIGAVEGVDEHPEALLDPEKPDVGREPERKVHPLDRPLRSEVRVAALGAGHALELRIAGKRHEVEVEDRLRIAVEVRGVQRREKGGEAEWGHWEK